MKPDEKVKRDRLCRKMLSVMDWWAYRTYEQLHYSKIYTWEGTRHRVLDFIRDRDTQLGVLLMLTSEFLDGRQ